MKRLKTIFLFTLTATLLTACSSSDDESTTGYSPNDVNVLFIQSSDGTHSTATLYKSGETYNPPRCYVGKEIIYMKQGEDPITRYYMSFGANVKGSQIIYLFQISLESDKPMSFSDLRAGDSFDSSQFKTHFYYTPTWMEAIMKGTTALSGKVTVTDKKQVDGKDYVVLRLTDFRFDAIDKSCIYTLNGLVEFEDLHLRYQE